MAATSTLTAKFQFVDGETYNLSFSPYDPEGTAVTGFKDRVNDFNANSVESISNTFISDAGAALKGIESAQIVTSEKIVFYERGAN